MDSKRKELGTFLQIIRLRNQPQDFGFAPGQRRRTAGLRREEMAQLIGISPTWYTWAEQGREVNLSAEVLDRLAERLRLTRSERAYLFEMADRRDLRANEAEEDAAPQPLIALLPEIASPAYIMGRHWDLLAWNQAACELFAGWLPSPTESVSPRPNLLRFVFGHPLARALLIDWETRARRITAEFRADSRSRLDAPALQRLVDELSASSADFSRFWKQHDVLERQGGQRDFQHPQRGLLSYEQITLKPTEQDHIKLVLLRPLSLTSTEKQQRMA